MNVLVAGDFCTAGRVVDLVNNGKYDTFLGEIANALCDVNYSIVNLECPVVEREAGKIRKLGPHLKCCRKSVEALKWAGFDCVTLANNHFMDYGTVGAKDTLKVVDEMGLDRVGAGLSFAEAAKVLYKGIEGEKLAIINCCEHEFSIATDTGPGCNELIPIRQYYTIQEARKNADYVLVIVHGGHEHWQLPSPRMQETYRFFIDAGADAVVNHHQHCLSGYERYNGKMIFYGLGNFCFDEVGQIGKPWNEGYMVVLNFDSSSFKVIPYEQCGTNASVRILQPGAYQKKIDELNEIISSKEALMIATEEYYKRNCRRVKSLINPIQNRWIKGAMNRGWIPGLSKKWFTTMENCVLCDAHREILDYFLKHV